MSGEIAKSVYIISDLHIGGVYGQTTDSRGFRINTHVPELAEFIRVLAENDPAKKQVELVINGDSVDFLAEKDGAPPYWNPFTHDPQVACAKLQAGAERDHAFFEALREFLDKGHRLTILLGNHDIELALPPVRQKLKEIIGVKSHHDYEFIGNGEAYIVADALIEHGNRYDSFNMVDHDNLRQVCSLLSRRQPVPEKYVFEPPAGSRMVSWVINDIKEEYKFIDLLKPETDVMVPILLALEPGYRRVLGTVAKLGLDARRHTLETAALPTIGGDIRADGVSNASFGADISTFASMGGPPPDEEEAALAEVLSGCIEGSAEDFLKTLAPAGTQLEPRIGSDISTATFIDRTLGLANLLLSRDDNNVSRRLPPLLKALRALQPDRSFDLDFEAAPEYLNAAKELMDGDFRYVIFGHTHQPKKIEVKPGCWYLNSGTWADVMKLSPEVITGSPEVAQREVKEFLQDIAANNLQKWIVFSPAYVRLDLEGNRVVQADVYEYRGPASVRDSAPMKKSASA
jgi:UDP-2,3-diacylglucosamine pyrophosphatase LpxH